MGAIYSPQWEKLTSKMFLCLCPFSFGKYPCCVHFLNVSISSSVAHFWMHHLAMSLSSELCPKKLLLLHPNPTHKSPSQRKLVHPRQNSSPPPPSFLGIPWYRAWILSSQSLQPHHCLSCLLNNTLMAMYGLLIFESDQPNLLEFLLHSKPSIIRKKNHRRKEE